MTSKTVNSSNFQDQRFDASVDENNDFLHRTILCMPIIHSVSAATTANTRKQSNVTSSGGNAANAAGVVGVFQLVNKFGGLPFTRNDENFVEAFALFCGMGLSNVRMYERAMVAMAKQQVTLEVLSYHAVAPMRDAVALARKRIPSAKALQLHSFSFDDFALDDAEMMQVGSSPSASRDASLVARTSSSLACSVGHLAPDFEQREAFACGVSALSGYGSCVSHERTTRYEPQPIRRSDAGRRNLLVLR